jgi:hypothetical protein
MILPCSLILLIAISTRTRINIRTLANGQKNKDWLHPLQLSDSMIGYLSNWMAQTLMDFLLPLALNVQRV